MRVKGVKILSCDIKNKSEKINETLKKINEKILDKIK